MSEGGQTHSQVQGSLGRDEKGPMIQNHSCSIKESRLDQPCGGMCCARCNVNERESTASGARESKLLRKHWMDLMLKETRLDAASPTGVKG